MNTFSLLTSDILLIEQYYAVIGIDKERNFFSPQKQYINPLIHQNHSIPFFTIRLFTRSNYTFFILDCVTVNILKLVLR